MRRWTVVVAVAVLALIAGVRVVPWLTTKQDVELSTPTSPPFNTGLTWLDLDPGHVLCVNPIDLSPNYHAAHLLVRGSGRLTLTIEAPGYSSTSHSAAQEGVVVVPVRMPQRRSTGVACMRNDGSQPFQLEGNVESRTQSLPTALLDGKPIKDDVPISFWRGKRESRAAALLDGIPRIAVFKPVGAWFFWTLLVLVLVAVPAAVIAALALGLRESP
jgi:hypothetical protein